MYGSSVAGGQGQVSEDPEGGTNEQQKEENVPLPSLRTLKRKAAVLSLPAKQVSESQAITISLYFHQDESLYDKTFSSLVNMQVVLFICACFSIILQNCTCAEMHVHA
jgi:hypothetical protein